MFRVIINYILIGIGKLNFEVKNTMKYRIAKNLLSSAAFQNGFKKKNASDVVHRVGSGKYLGHWNDLVSFPVLPEVAKNWLHQKVNLYTQPFVDSLGNIIKALQYNLVVSILVSILQKNYTRPDQKQLGLFVLCSRRNVIKGKKKFYDLFVNMSFSKTYVSDLTQLIKGNSSVPRNEIFTA